MTTRKVRTDNQVAAPPPVDRTLPFKSLGLDFTSPTGEAIASLVAPQKQFSSGSVGFYGNGKIVMKGERYQVGVTIVKIGTKNAA